MRREHRFVLTCAATTCASLVAAVVPVPAVPRALIALPLVFVLPGEAILRALDLQFTRCARAPIVVGISMAVTLLGGFVLDWLGGLTPLGWAAWLGGASVLAAATARHGGTCLRPALPTFAVRHVLMLAATCGVLVLTVLSTIRSTELFRPFPYTNFWMLPQGAAIDAYLIGIKNGEGRPETYAVRLMVDHRMAGEWQDLVLAPGQWLAFPVTVPPGMPAQAWLFRAEQPQVIYRTVTVAGNEEMGGVSATSTTDGAS
jgi:hypothetical protein